jgi:hypothetical protein
MLFVRGLEAAATFKRLTFRFRKIKLASIAVKPMIQSCLFFFGVY